MDPVPVLYGFLVAVLLLAAGWRPWARGNVRSLGPWSNALALAGAYLAAYHSIHGRLPRFPPTAIKHWVPLLVLASLASCLLRGASRRSALRRAGFAAGLLAPFLYLSLASLRRQWDGGEQALWLGGLWIAGVGYYVLVGDLLERRSQGPDAPLAWLLSCVALAVVLGQSTGASALLVGALTCVPGGWLVLSLWRPDLPLTLGVLPRGSPSLTKAVSIPWNC